MNTTNYFVDTEFISNVNTFSLISIGVVCEDGRELYLQNLDCEFDQASEWVQKHVFSHLAWFSKGKPHKSSTFQCDIDIFNNIWMNEGAIGEKLRGFTKGDFAQFWGYYADWDWVLVNMLFGGMLHIPNNWNQCCYDLRQFLDFKGLKTISQSDSIHHALLDARWMKKTYETYAK